MNFILFSSIISFVEEILRSLNFSITTLCYQLVIYFYDIFVRLGTAQILSTSQVQSIYSRVTLVLGIFMLFKMIFSFVQYLLNPELMSDKSKGASKLILKAVVVVALLGTCPFIFQEAFKLQSIVLESNVLGKIIMGSDNAGDNVSDFGSELSSYMFLSFYSLYEGEYCDAGGDDLSDIKDEISRSHSFDLAKKCLNEEGVNVNHDFAIYYPGNGLLGLAVSFVVLYIISSYCLSVGIRVIQLAFLQLISPIPILSYLGEDKDGAFSNWLKRCVSTFIDLFIRLGIIYFVVFIINLVMSDSSSYYLLMSTTGSPSGMTEKLIVIVIILSLLFFAKKAPDLLKELLPKGIGNNIGFGLDLGKNLKTAKEMASPVGRAIGFAGGLGVGGIMSGLSRFNANRNAGNGILRSIGAGGVGLVTGGLSTALRSTKKGNPIKNIQGAYQKRVEADDRYTIMVSEGGTTLGKWGTRIRGSVTETKAQKIRRESKELSEYGNYLGNIKKMADNFDYVDKLKKQYDVAVSSGNQAAAAAAEKKMKQARKGAATYSMLLMDGIDMSNLEYVGTDSNGRYQYADKSGKVVLSSADETVSFAYDFTHDVQADGTVVNHLDSSDTQYIASIQAEVKQKDYDANNIESLRGTDGVKKKTRTYNEVQNSSSAASTAASEGIPENMRKLEAEDKAARVRDRFSGRRGTGGPR